MPVSYSTPHNGLMFVSCVYISLQDISFINFVTYTRAGHFHLFTGTWKPVQRHDTFCLSDSLPHSCNLVTDLGPSTLSSDKPPVHTDRFTHLITTGTCGTKLWRYRVGSTDAYRHTVRYVAQNCTQLSKNSARSLQTIIWNLISFWGKIQVPDRIGTVTQFNSSPGSEESPKIKNKSLDILFMSD